MYALNLSDDNRILSVTFEQFASEGMPIVDELPQGNVTDYLYVDEEYVYDPIPQLIQIEPTDNFEKLRADVDFIAMMTDVDLEG